MSRSNIGVTEVKPESSRVMSLPSVLDVNLFPRMVETREGAGECSGEALQQSWKQSKRRTRFRGECGTVEAGLHRQPYA
jgi:hypothetical protein